MMMMLPIRTSRQRHHDLLAISRRKEELKVGPLRDDGFGLPYFPSEQQDYDQCSYYLDF